MAKVMCNIMRKSSKFAQLNETLLYMETKQKNNNNIKLKPAL